MSTQVHEKDFKFVYHVLQKAKTDTEKLAALLVVGKLFVDKQLSDDEKLRLLNGIGFDFLLKLLDDYYLNICQTDTTVIECYDDKTFCLDIIVYFFPTIIENFEDCEVFIEQIFDILFEKIKILKQNQSEDISDFNDIITCLDFVNIKVKEQFFNDQQKNLLIKIYLRIVDAYLILDSHYKLKFLDLLVRFTGCLDEPYFNLLMSDICRLFASDETINKFKLCQLINSIICNKQIDHFERKGLQCWLVVIRGTLFDIFKNRLNESFRNDAIKLVSQLTLSFNNLSWIRLDSWNEDNSKFFLLLLRLICIEVQMFFLNPCFEGGKSKNIDDCFIILEHLILYFIENLSEDDKDENKLQISNSEILSSISAITETLSKVIQFVKEVATKYKSPTPEDDIFDCLVAAIRLISIYVIEETEALRNEIAEIVPFIFHLFKENKDKAQFESVKLQIIAAITILYEDDDLRKIIELYNMDIYVSR